LRTHVLETLWKIGRACDRDTLSEVMRGPDLVGSSLLRCSAWVAMLWLANGTGACSVEEGGAGQDCLRSAECAQGLVCIEGVCSDDLSSIADPGEVPMLTPEEASLEPESDAGAVPVDAAMVMPPSDAAITMPPVDAAMVMPPSDATITMPPADGG
jgi:hypothetical protein